MLKTYTNNVDFVPRSIFLAGTEEEQEVDGRPGLIQMLDGRPMANVDVLLVSKRDKTVILPTRRLKPAEGLWFIGGGIKRDQDLSEAAAKAVSRETGLEIAAERCSFLTVNRFVWDYWDNPPHENGRVDINFCFVAELSDAELAGITLNEKEYNADKGLTAYTREELVTALKDENPAKQVLVDYYDLVFDV